MATSYNLHAPASWLHNEPEPAPPMEDHNGPVGQSRGGVHDTVAFRPTDFEGGNEYPAAGGWGY